MPGHLNGLEERNSMMHVLKGATHLYGPRRGSGIAHILRVTGLLHEPASCMCLRDTTPLRAAVGFRRHPDALCQGRLPHLRPCRTPARSRRLRERRSQRHPTCCTRRARYQQLLVILLYPAQAPMNVRDMRRDVCLTSRIGQWCCLIREG